MTISLHQDERFGPTAAAVLWCSAGGGGSGVVGDDVVKERRSGGGVCGYKKGVYNPSGGEKYSNGSETRAPEQPAWDLYTNRHASPDS
ncbi:unnamed protein product [Macrosiphum euphorbiae]|uniref:Uncharacterized protein n=1 Tax=Macrosiphum euphorbiae TaxID=13131 RepID=A0AAV0WW68_9HEMI|nr:unnamed protein product [Macrosiphum euphorbiae]